MKKIILPILVLVLFLTAKMPAYAADTYKVTKNSITTSQMQNFGYLLYTPENAQPGMPLIVYLHGGSGKGDNLDSLMSNNGFPKYLNDGTLSDIPAYVVIPQLPSNKNGWSDVKVSVRKLIQTVSKTYGINTNKISLTGHSMGGTGTWSVASSYPGLFSCIAPLSGSIDDTEKNISALAGMPVWAFVGAEDTIVDPEKSINFITDLKAVNNNAQITILDGATHFDVPELTYLDTDINIVNWLISNSKV